jgi:predicted transcriptional regulator
LSHVAYDTTVMGVDPEKRATLRRFAAVGAASPLARLADGDATGSGGDAAESETREAIAGYVMATPGAHFSKLRDDLKLGTGETQYHLRKLVDAGVVDVHRDGDYKRFYPAGRFTGFEQVALGYLRRDTARALVIELLQHPGASGADLAAALDVSPATVSRHAKELDVAGLLSREDGYSVQEPETVIALLLRYADSFDEATATFASGAAGLLRYDP